jgi:alginate O-acetyltransferase complex protein AlgI
MSFSSITFLWYFMPTALAAYWLLPRRARNAVIAITSLVFYAWGAGAFCVVLIDCMALNYLAGLLIDRPGAPPRQRTLVLVAIAVVDVGVLAVWKYGGFATAQLHALGQVLGTGATPIVGLALPIGISFFTFHHLSYVVDVYRRDRTAQRNPLSFATYIAMFPQLIAGPIVRYRQIADQLPAVSRERWADFGAGFPRFSLGLAKKVLVADSIAPLANAAFTTSPANLTTPAAWLGVVAYTLQIYFDFSGYSDMAIGLGRMFGFQLPENFARPYSAVSITDFWRRWHMSLSLWFRDYLYIPLGGNRVGRVRHYLNLYIVFALVGFWHGANWTFLLWGLYHGTLLVAERLTGVATWAEGAWWVPRRAATLLLVMFGWILFRANSVPDAVAVMERLVVWRGGPTPAAVAMATTHLRLFALAAALAVVLLPPSWVTGQILQTSTTLAGRALRIGYSALAAPCAAVMVAAGTFSPFLYYRF